MKNVTGLKVICSAIAIAVPLSVSAQSTPASPDRPNIVVILADDLGWSDTAPFGSEIRTPNIQKLADGGKKFTQFYNTARCCPSRASLLTGLYPHQAGIGHMLWDTGYPGYSTWLTSDSVTMAEVLHDAGYSTYMTGKWHLTERVPDREHPTGWPLQRGFDKFYGTLQGYGSYFDPATLCRGFTYITPENDPKYKPDNFYYTDAISDNAIMFLDEHEQQQDQKPFFMYVAYTAAHWPLHVPEDTLKTYDSVYDAGYDAIRAARVERQREMGLIPDVATTGPTVGDWDKVKDKDWETRRMEAFAAIITRMDTGIGKIIDQLKKSGELENTLVLYVQDNGGCDEEFFMRKNPRVPKDLHVMGPNELQTRTLPPMQTRDGKPVIASFDVMAGPPTSFVGYGPGWANVSNTPFRKFKKFIHEGGIATPLIAHWPASMGDPNGAIVSKPGHLIDIMPTLVELADATYPARRSGHEIQPMEGESLVPLLTGGGEFDRENPIFWEHQGNRGVRDGKWKLVAEEDSPWELYDMSVDRAEINNLAAGHPDLVEKMSDQWNAYADRARVRPYGAHRLRSRPVDLENAPTRLVLETGDVFGREHALALSDRGVSITAHISEMAPEGVIIAQGAGAAGYTLYMKNGKAHFAVRRSDDLMSIASEPIETKGPAIIKARLAHDGMAVIQVNDDPPVTKNFYGPLLETPNEALSVGFDQDGPVGDYPKGFSFMGMIDKVVVETLISGSL